MSKQQKRMQKRAYARLQFEEDSKTASNVFAASSAIIGSAINNGSEPDEDDNSRAVQNSSYYARNAIRRERITNVRKEKDNLSKGDRLIFDDIPKHDSDRNVSKRERLKLYQRIRQKRRYQAELRAARKGTTSVSKTEQMTVFDTIRRSKVAQAFKPESKVRVVMIIAIIIVGSVFAIAGSMMAVSQGVAGTFIATTYPSQTEEMKKCESYYCDLEGKLNVQINAIESDHPGYDEYRYNVDAIWHNPYHLMSYLSVMHGEFTFDSVKDELKMLFERQYCVSTRTLYEIDDEGNQKKILDIKLTNSNLDSIVRSLMNSDEAGWYDAFNVTYGNRADDLWGTEVGYGNGEYPDYIPSREAMSDERFARMYREAIKYLGTPYVWGGYSPRGFDCSGFVSYVINHCGNGWNIGHVHAGILRDITSGVPKGKEKPGDLIFFQGTYATSGVSHVGIVIGDGKMIHCGDPCKISSYKDSYWQAHFHSFGRLP